MQTPKQGHEKKSPREKPPETMETPPFQGIPSFPGDRVSRPREGAYLHTPLAEVGLRRPLFRRWHLGLLCGAGVVRWWRSEEAVPRK